MTEDCPFCRTDRPQMDKPAFVNETCFFLESNDAVLQHSGMIIPFRHVISPFEFTPSEWRDTFNLLGIVRAHLDKAEPQGYNIGWNVGSVGGQTVNHAHLHVIARFADEPLAGQGIRHHLKRLKNSGRSSEGR